LAGHALLGAVLPIINELVSAKEQHGADGRLIEPGGVEDVGNGRSRARVISRGKVKRRKPVSGPHWQRRGLDFLVLATAHQMRR
jgi:hypothetical protein